ncbi:hypothetical protein [Algoriphagus sp.]|uniref:hypothetical protein n=1 Tax=Algoriphagus sp. TaxID=1872435 RepID=UPI00262E3AAB|nr:hypothetical protein [Algoriphagus sp.]
MKIPNTQPLNLTQTLQLLDHLKNQGFEFSYRSGKHQLVIESKGIQYGKLFLPWQYQWSENQKLEPITDFHLAVVAIRSGQAVCGYFHGENLINHKVIRAYMVRKKQGKSQIKHLKTKGKSRAGSRIRLEETERFFNQINERLNEYHAAYPIDRWGIACSKTLWPYFFGSQVTPPVDQQSEKLLPLPVHFNLASFEEIQQLPHILFQSHWLISNSKDDFLTEWIGNESQKKEWDEDW